MKVPGKAWLQFRSMPHVDGTTSLEQTVIFAPKSVFGLIYWYSLYPIHKWIFKGLIKQIARKAEEFCCQDI